MRCYGLTANPGTGSGCRFSLSAAKPISLSGVGTCHRPESIKFPIRIGVGSLKLHVKVKATVNDGFVDELSFYELLGIPESGSLVDVKQAYKQLARKYHPDVSPPDRIEEHTKRFILVHEAYETLSDPARRAIYDSDMARPRGNIHFAFSSAARRRHHRHHQVSEQKKNEWKGQWQSQLSELKRRSGYKEGDGNMSWAARMRQQKDHASNQEL